MIDPRRAQIRLYHRSVATGALMGLMFGFDTAVIAGVGDGVRAAFHLNAASWGVTVSAALWGTLIGALTAGGPGDRMGARNCLRFVAGLYFLSSLLAFIAPDWPLLLAARFGAGLGVGASSVLAPVYVAELAPARRRGLMVGAFQFSIVAGVLLAYLSNFLIDLSVLPGHPWRVKLAVAAAPALGLLALLMTIPQSPRWLRARGRLDEAEMAAAALGLETEAQASPPPASEGAESRLSWRRHGRAMLLAGSLALFNQLSGINAILYYLNDIFAQAGFSHTSAAAQSVLIGLVNLICTGLALAVIDRFGRRRLLLIGSAGLVAALGAVTLIFWFAKGGGLLLPALVLFIGAFAFSQGAVIWVYLSEIFPAAVRGRGQGFGASVHWVANAVIAGLFPVAAATLGGWVPFAFFTLCMALQAIVVWRFFPETRGVDLEKVQEILDAS